MNSRWGSRGREFKSRHSDQETPRFHEKSRSFYYFLTTNEAPVFRGGGIWVELRKNRVGKAPPEAVWENPAKARHFAGLRPFGLRPKTRPIVQMRDCRKSVNGENSVSAELKRARKQGRVGNQRSRQSSDGKNPTRVAYSQSEELGAERKSTKGGTRLIEKSRDRRCARYGEK